MDRLTARMQSSGLLLIVFASPRLAAPGLMVRAALRPSSCSSGIPVAVGRQRHPQHTRDLSKRLRAEVVVAKPRDPTFERLEAEHVPYHAGRLTGARRVPQDDDRLVLEDAPLGNRLVLGERDGSLAGEMQLLQRDAK